MGINKSECKNCGSNLKYDPIKQILECVYCKTSYYLPKSKTDAVLVRGYSNAFHPNQLNKSLNCYKCEMCGHTYFVANEEKSSECSDCGNPSCIKVKSAGYCADGIIPFEISKEQAIEKLKSHLTKINAKKQFFESATVENLTGVFVPVWNFIFDVEAEYRANAVELKLDSNGRYYGIPFPVYGTKCEQIKSADQCATTAEDDELLELFNEYDYDKIIPYTPEYTYGYKVDDINKNIHEYYDLVTEDAKENLRKEISSHILKKYKDVSGMNITTDCQEVYFNFTYVPVYVYKIKHKNKTHKIYISGTSGKAVGKTPSSLKNLFKELIKFFGLVAAIALLSYFLFK